MKQLSPISDDKFISLFLQSEITSKRWGKKLRDFLDKDDKPESIITKPDLDDTHDNEYRKELIAKFRGYGIGKELFDGFPNDVKWYTYSLSSEELEQVKYIDYSYWNKLSNNTRLPKVAADEVKKGSIIFDQPNTNFHEAAETLKDGNDFPLMMFVGKSEDDYLVILEGHVRMTAYYLVPECIPDEIGVVVGFSKNITDWGLY